LIGGHDSVSHFVVNQNVVFYYHSGDQIVSRRPPLPPHSVQITVPNPLQS
jgi:hypothetical protein